MRKLLVLLILLFASVAEAQVAPAPFTKAQYFTSSGVPCAGCRLFTYAAGTTTQIASYKNSAGTQLNTNPIILDSAGRADIWLTSAAYKLVLQTNAGSLIWSEDGITASNIALLGLNNIWTGTNTFNGAVITNSSFTANGGIFSIGPNNLSGGGLLNGTFGGSPTFSGIPNFSAGFLSTTGTFSDQITSTVATGTPPFVVASTTKVANLDADFLDGCWWGVPCAIGNVTPTTGVFTTLQANTSFTLNGSPAMTAVDGTGTHLASSSAVTPATGAPACYDANDALTNVGCTAVLFTQRAKNTSVCTTGSLTYDTCDTVVTWPVPFAASTYDAVCGGYNANDPRAAVQGIISQGTTSVTVRIVTNGTNPITYASLRCIGVL